MAHALFTVQELVDAIVYFISDSEPALWACALVSRSWVHPTQSLLFCQIYLNRFTSVARPARWFGLKRTLEISPHLVHHIRRLRLNIALEDHSIISSICNFPFTHLQHVDWELFGTMQTQHALDLRQLFSLSTVRQVKLTSSFEPQVFFRIFERCSPTCRDLELTLSCSLPLPTVRDAEVTTPIPLVSLWLTLFGSGTLDRRLLPFLCPFSLSHLKELYTGTTTDDIPWHELYPAFNGLELLSVPVKVRIFGLRSAPVPISVQYTKALDLSQFSNFSYLCISMGMSSTSQEEMATLLSTVTATHHIREFRFWFATIKAPVLEVDTAMSTVDIPIVKVRVYEEGWVKFFLQLREKKYGVELVHFHPSEYTDTKSSF
ncbi:hypothetical protein B0H13DRAFT_2667761 [Mycena leptocephala]|nr:hypothetical protein B0H13DRAFT_2667761 [Mycena leptocephala]